MSGAASLATIVGDIGITDKILTARTDGAGTNLFIAELCTDGFFSFEGAFTEQVGGIVELHAVIIDKQMRPAVATVVQHQTIPTSTFESDREPTAGEAIADEAGQG